MKIYTSEISYSLNNPTHPLQICSRKLGKGGELMSFDMLLLDEQWKMIRPYLGRIENWVLPNAFDDEDKPYLSKHARLREHDKEEVRYAISYESDVDT
ncbi:hypothetical protein YC2023_090029 [Brassica napus]